MSKNEEDGLVVEIDPRQLDLTLDPEAERKAKSKDNDVVEARAKKDDVEPSGSDDAIVALQKQLDALKEENARTKAAYELKAREADEALTNASRSHGHAMQTQYDLVNTDIANGKARSEAIKREMKIARETGDTDRESDLIIENARIGVSLENSERKKRDLEVRAHQEQQRRESQPARVADPFEAALHGVSPKSQSWLRAHPECVTDDVMNAKVLLADKEARRKGLSVDTPEYFSYIEEKMGYRTPESEEDDEVETRKPERSERRTYAAPPSRDSTPGSSLKPSQRRLSREQVEVAESLGMTPAQYATWLAKAEKDQKYVNH